MAELTTGLTGAGTGAEGAGGNRRIQPRDKACNRPRNRRKLQS